MQLCFVYKSYKNCIFIRDYISLFRKILKQMVPEPILLLFRLELSSPGTRSIVFTLQFSFFSLICHQKWLKYREKSFHSSMIFLTVFLDFFTEENRKFVLLQLQMIVFLKQRTDWNQNRWKMQKITKTSNYYKL